jgi:predicted ester cyclase
VAVDDVLVEDDRVAARLTLRGTHIGDFSHPTIGTITATGRAVTVTQSHTFRIAGNRISEHDAVRDDLDLLRQLGALPTTSMRDVALRYVQFLHSGDQVLLDTTFAEDFHDHISGRGRDIMRTVHDWLDASFADRTSTVHAVAATGDLVLVWFTSRGTHVGSAFPFLAGRPPSGRTVDAESVHILRVRGGHITEHWAVRDDLGVLRRLDTTDADLPDRVRPILTDIPSSDHDEN